MTIMPSNAELLRMHELAGLRDERDAALAENQRLRELYENAVGNRERFGWTINHLLECEEALRVAQESAADAVQARQAAITEWLVQHVVHPQSTIVECSLGRYAEFLESLTGERA